MRKRLIVLTFLTLSACGAPTEPSIDRDLRSRAVPIPLSEEMRGWWTEMEACTGRTRDVDALHFAVVEVQADPFHYYFETSHGHALGVYYEQHALIIFAEGFERMDRVVKHEMVHALIGAKAGHPDHYFRGVCGQLMMT